MNRNPLPASGIRALASFAPDAAQAAVSYIPLGWWFPLAAERGLRELHPCLAHSLSSVVVMPISTQ